MTLKDIAAMAGVSVATVSNVLNHKDNKVSPEVASRIIDIIQEVNYQPSTVAKALRSSKSRIMGILTEDLSVWQVGNIVQGVTHCAQEQGYSIVLSDLGLKSRIQSRYDDIYRCRWMIDEAIAGLRNMRVDGIIFVAMHDRDVSGLINTDVPVVYSYCSAEKDKGVQVRYDNQDISEKIASMLLARYGTHIGFVGGPAQSAPAGQRMKGVEIACEKAGVLPDCCLREYGDWGYESGVQACARLLEKAKGSLRAVYAFNDLMAFGVIHKLKESGFCVPQDVGVIGFDDNEACLYMDPALTTVRVPLDEIGRQSAKALIGELDAGRSWRRQICMECSLIKRESFR